MWAENQVNEAHAPEGASRLHAVNKRGTEEEKNPGTTPERLAKGGGPYHH